MCDIYLPAACFEARLSLLDVFCVVVVDVENKSLNGSKRFIFWFDEDFVSVLRTFVVVAWIGAGKVISDAFRCNIGLSNGIEWKSKPSKLSFGAENVDWWVSICKLNKSFSGCVNIGGGGGFVSSLVISRRVPTAMSSFVWGSSFNGGFDSICCSWNRLGIGDVRRGSWGEDGLLTLEICESRLGFGGTRRDDGDSDAYDPRYWWPSPN